MKAILEKIFASLVSIGIHRLHNRNTPKFSREEIRYLRLSFSAFGEDIGLGRWFDEFFHIQNGVYVDAGAYHPIHCSNTLLLHKKGWRGVSIDMNADKIALFNALRPGDVNVHAAVSNVSGKARALRSGLVEEMVLDPNGDIPVRRLDDILASTSFRKIDYLNIDCEGHDYDALRSIDLDLYQPKIITIEALGEEASSRLGDHLASKGYTLEEKFHFTLLFVRRRTPA
jgi:FkbM family methyltransferase